MREYTKEELLENQDGYITVGMLKSIIEELKVPDEAIIMVERISDFYFEEQELCGFKIEARKVYLVHNGVSGTALNDPHVKEYMSQYLPIGELHSDKERNFLFIGLI